VGYLADHYRTRFFILGGPLLAIVFIPFVGIAPSFLVLLLAISLGSIGSSMFHPTTAGMVSPYSGRHFGFSMSVFNMGGTLAFAVGPLFITYFVSSYGLRASPFTMIFGLAVMALLFRIIPLPAGETLENLGFIRSIEEALGMVWKSIMLIWVVMVLRAFVAQSFLIFVPVLAISGLLAGHLSDRIGYKPIFYFAHSLTTPSLYLLLYLPGNWIYFTVFLAGFFAMATLPLGVTMAQELAPKGRSMVSSLMMGLAFGLGGMMTTLTGKLADTLSIQGVLGFLAIIPFLTTGLISQLPEKQSKYHEAVV
jgi:FSR family fosmidomycin resistance protein-like MFS transporter